MVTIILPFCVSLPFFSISITFFFIIIIVLFQRKKARFCFNSIVAHKKLLKKMGKIYFRSFSELIFLKKNSTISFLLILNLYN